MFEDTVVLTVEMNLILITFWFDEEPTHSSLVQLQFALLTFILAQIHN